MKRYGIPLLVIIIGCLMLFGIRNYIFFSFKDSALVILSALLLFVLGISMSNRSKKSNGWLKKVVILTLMVLMVLIELGVLRISFLSMIFSKIGSVTLIFSMLYIYFGFIFF